MFLSGVIEFAPFYIYMIEIIGGENEEREKGMSRRDFFGVVGKTALVAGSMGLGIGCSAVQVEERKDPSEPNVGKIPTVELHRHFESGMSPETIAELAEKNKIDRVFSRNGKELIQGVDIRDPDSITAYYKRIFEGFSRPDGFSKFLDSLGLPVGVMRTLDDLEMIAYQQIVDQAKAGSIHTELRGSPYTYQEALNQGKAPAKGVSLVDVIYAIRSGIERAYIRNGASGAFIACVSRNKADKYGEAVVKAVTSTHSDLRPVGFDISGGPEDKFPPRMFKRLIDEARDFNVPITMHAGEQAKWPDFKEAPASFVRDAIELGAKRVGHALSLMADHELRTLAWERNIFLECCPVGNAKLGYISMERHPLKQYLDAGLSATLNTDDPLMFGVSSVRDILDKHMKELRLIPADLIQMTKNGINGAFVPESRRDELMMKFERSSL